MPTFTLDHLHELLDYLSDGVSLHAPDCTLLFANRALADGLGFDPADLVGVDTFSFIHRDDLDAVRAAFLAVVAGEHALQPVQYRVPSAKGWRWVESVATSYLDDSTITAVLVTSRDVDSRVRAEARLRIDALTGLPNRIAALEHLERTAIDGLLLVDLDGFKTVNAVGGSPFADEALRVTGARLQSAAPDAFVARLSGDEFLVAVSGTDVGALAEDVKRAVSEPFAFDGRRLRPSASVGLVLADPGDSVDKLLTDAGTALRDAKERGGGLVVPFDSRLRARLHRWVALRDQLRDAAEHGAFALAFQPIVCLPGGDVHSAEALLRPGPGRSFATGEAIKVAEDTGLIVPIGAWVLRAGLVALERAGPEASLSVNASPRQLTEPGFVERVGELLAARGIAPRSVGFEITESLAMHDVDGTVAALSALRELGCRIGLDDFGTGRSSLSHLRRLPIDFVKIDRSFVDPLASDPTASTMVEAMVAMCDALHVDVIAEGVEREEQRDALVAAGCRYAQGYLFGRPGADIPLPSAHSCALSTRALLHHGRLTIDVVRRVASVDGVDRKLTRRELDLLAWLAASPGHVFTKEELLLRVWGSKSEWQNPSTVTEHVLRIRRKIEDDPKAPRWIQNVRGVGYRFDPGPFGSSQRDFATSPHFRSAPRSKAPK